jgi:hypothetical protein
VEDVVAHHGDEAEWREGILFWTNTFDFICRKVFGICTKRQPSIIASAGFGATKFIPSFDLHSL